ncbi:MAG TPA: CHAT domain-containing protein, partial [Gemmatimonadaceae bacterium]
ISEALAIAAKINTPSARVDAALGKARFAQRIGDQRETINAVKRARSDIASARVAGQWEAYALEARAYAALGKLDSAEIAGKKAVVAAERVRSRIGTGSLRTTFMSERSAVYADLVVTLLRLNKRDEAFAVADGARGRELLEHLAEASRDISRRETRNVADGERLLRQIDELTRMLNEADRVPQRERASVDEERLNAIAGRLAKLEGEYESLVTRKSGDLRALTVSASTTSLQQVQKSLGADEALIEYMVTPNRLVIFVARRNALSQHWSDAGEDDIAGRVRVARGIAAKREGLGEGDNAVFRGLDELLIAPIEKSGALKGVKRLVMVPHAALTYVPFAALIDARGKYLSDRYSILHAPSAASLASIRNSEPPRRRSSHAVVLAPFPDLLPSTKREAQDVEQSLSSSRILIGPRATERALRTALGESPIVHVASHGLLNRRNPLFSRIELARPNALSATSADDGRLDVHELFGMNIVSSLVFLSGCETGVGSAWSTDFARGDDFATLAQAFLFSGAREVVATLWRVDDEAAAAFASAFYRNMKVMPPPEAMARAQQEARRNPRMKAPYYWAAYTLSGSGDRLNLEKPWWNPFN